jgi:heme/copper-type cytochrome/quinol oxidase subunit 2
MFNSPSMLVIAALAAAAPLLGLLVFFLWQRRRPAEDKPTYRLNRKTLAVAVLTEILVAGAGILGVVVWASQYGNDEATRWLMMAVGLNNGEFFNEVFRILAPTTSSRG